MANRIPKFSIRGIRNRISTSRLSTIRTRVLRFIDTYPLQSFFILLAILFILIAAANFLKPKAENIQATPPTKAVSVYKIGVAPRIQVQAKVEKSGVITITSLTSGVVSEINVTEGQEVGRGYNLIQLASNYQGGNAPATQAQLAQAQYDNNVANYDLQKTIIDKQRDIANKNQDNTDQLRDISKQSLNDTRSLLDQNQDILNSIDTNLNTLEASPSGTQDQLILSTKQLRAQYQSTINSLNAQIRQLDYSTNTDKPQQQLSVMQKDLTLKQLDLQQRTLDFTLETSLIQLRLAQISAATMHPVAPISGTVQRIFVKPGEAVNPGTPLISLSGDSGRVVATAYVPSTIAQKASRIEASTLHIGESTLSEVPSFISQDATNGQLYSILFSIPDENQKDVTDGGSILVDLPIGYADTGSTIPFIPLDAVFQTQDESFVYLAKNGKAVAKKLELGNVFGRFVQVQSGLSNSDQVILNRTIVNGDSVIVQ